MSSLETVYLRRRDLLIHHRNLWVLGICQLAVYVAITDYCASALQFHRRITIGAEARRFAGIVVIWKFDDTVLNNRIAAIRQIGRGRVVGHRRVDEDGKTFVV